MPRNIAARFAAIAQEQVDPHVAPAEHHLVAAVLGSGVAEATWADEKLASRDHGTSQPSRGERDRAREWLADDGDHPWGVVWCCQHLGLDVDAVRERVQRAVANGRTIRSDHLFHGSRNKPGQRIQLRSERLQGRQREGGPWSGLER